MLFYPVGAKHSGNNLLVEAKDMYRNADAYGTLRERPYYKSKTTVCDRVEYKQLFASQSKVDSQNFLDPKNRFQQWAQAKHRQNAEYFIIDQSGPDHAKEFTAEVRAILLG